MRRRRQPIYRPEQSLDQRPPLITLVVELGEDPFGPLLVPGDPLLPLRSGYLLASYRRLLTSDCFFLVGDCFFLALPRCLYARP